MYTYNMYHVILSYYSYVTTSGYLNVLTHGNRNNDDSKHITIL